MKFTGTDKYVATDDLQMAVNAAIALQRPLLIKGEPGTGKTLLAEEMAAALGMTLIPWHIKSTTKAQQGLYEYDAVSRLRDSQLGDEKVKDIRNYIVKGKLWEAFEADEQVVLLIDEIDKADIEFPNDLLLELAEKGKLNDREVLEEQVMRMLADPRSESLATRFATQWLRLEELDLKRPLPVVFPDFSRAVSESMRRETELLFDHLVREAHAGAAGRRVNNIRAAVKLAARQLAAFGRIVPCRRGRAGHVLIDLDIGIHIFRAFDVAEREFADQRDVHTTDEANFAGFRGHCCRHANQE